MHTIEGDFATPAGRIALVASRFNDFIVGPLIAGASDTLRRHGVKPDNIVLIRVPGAYELPLAIERVAAKAAISGVIALGCVIRGATAHFDYVSGAAANGVLQASLKTGKPVAFGVLTVDSIEQGIERAGSKAGNKGSEAALALIEQINVLNALASL